MKIAVVAGILLLGCTSPEDRHRRDAMDRIERMVRLPAGAYSLDEYARFYADAGDRKVEAIYLIPYDYRAGPGESCSATTLDGNAAAVPCDHEALPWEEVRAGERRWVEGIENLPSILDGGCTVVKVLFDRATGQVERAACNGEA